MSRALACALSEVYTVKNQTTIIRPEVYRCPICGTHYRPDYNHQVYCCDICYGESRLYRQRVVYGFRELAKLGFELEWPTPIYFNVKLPDCEAFKVPESFHVTVYTLNTQEMLDLRAPVERAFKDTFKEFSGYLWQAVKSANEKDIKHKCEYCAVLFKALCCQQGEYYQCVTCHKRYANIPVAREWNEFGVGFKCLDCLLADIPF